MNTPPPPLWLTIVSLGITGSIVGAVIAALASLLNDRSRRRFELQRWRAEFYFRPKLEALRSLHAALVHSHYEINRRAQNRMPKSAEEYRDSVERQVMDFSSALALAEIYLDSETRKLTHEVLGSVRQMSKSIELQAFDNPPTPRDADIREPGWQSFATSFDAAHASGSSSSPARANEMGRRMNPESL